MPAILTGARAILEREGMRGNDTSLPSPKARPDSPRLVIKSAAQHVCESQELMGEVLSYLHYWDMSSTILALVHPHHRHPFRHTVVAARKRDRAASIKIKELVGDVLRKAKEQTKERASRMKVSPLEDPNHPDGEGALRTECVQLGKMVDRIVASGAVTLAPLTVYECYTQVYALCRFRSPYDFADQLYDLYSEVIASVALHLLPAKPRMPDPTTEDMQSLRQLRRGWARYRKVTSNVRKVFMYLHRHGYKLKDGIVPGLEEICTKTGRDALMDRFDAIVTDAGNDILEFHHEELDRVLVGMHDPLLPLEVESFVCDGFPICVA